MAATKKTSTQSLSFDFPELKKKGEYLQENNSSGKIPIQTPDGVVLRFNPAPKEREAADKIYRRCSRKAVLKINEDCTCKRCVDNTFKSLFNIRKTLEEAGEMVPNINSPLYLLIEYADLAIRRFADFAELYPPEEQKHKIKYHAAVDKLLAYVSPVFEEIYQIAGIKKQYGFYGFMETLPPPKYFPLIAQYANEDKLIKLYRLLCDGTGKKKYIVKGTFEDFKELFNGGKANRLEWDGVHSEVIFFLVLLFVLTVENPESLRQKGRNIKPKICLDIMNRFNITGGDSFKKSNMGPMLTTYKGFIVNNEGIYKRDKVPPNSMNLIEIVKEAFDINELIPPKL
ncbi:MAG: hypothetical protein ACLQQ4_15185 [Bacteroidia bacterium]